MQQSGIVGFDTQGNPERVNDLRDAPFCSKHVFAKLLGIDVITEDVVRGWIESGALPTANICRHRVINLHRILSHSFIVMTMRYAPLLPGHLVSALRLSPLQQSSYAIAL